MLRRRRPWGHYARWGVLLSLLLALILSIASRASAGQAAAVVSHAPQAQVAVFCIYLPQIIQFQGHDVDSTPQAKGQVALELLRCGETPTATPSPTATFTATRTPSPTATFTATRTPSVTTTPTSTATPTPTSTATATLTPSPTATATATMTPTPTATTTPTVTASFTATATATVSSSVTVIPTASATLTSTPLPSLTPTLTVTLEPPVTPTATTDAYPQPTPPTFTPTVPSYPGPQDTPTPMCADSYEPDNYSFEAQPIVPDAGWQARNFHLKYDRDWAYFDAVAGKVYTVDTGQLADYVVTELLLYDSATETLLASDQYGNDEIRAAHITWTAPASGRYLVLVRAFETSAWGCPATYQLRVATTP